VKRILSILLTLASACTSTAVGAHKPSDAYLTLATRDTQVDVRWDVALRDLDNELGLDANDDGQLTWGEVRVRGRDIAALMLPALTLATSHGPCQLQQTRDASALAGTRPAPGAAAAPGVALQLDQHSDGTYAVLRYTVRCPVPLTALDVDYRLFAASDPTHRGIIRVIARGNGAVTASVTAVLGPDTPHRRFDLAQPSVADTLREFITEGVWHIWLGFDHILFLLSLLLPAVLARRVARGAGTGDSEPPPGLRTALLDVLKTVTAFTLAHSITLSLAVLDVVSLPSRFVESAIALTVVLASLNNLWPLVRDYRWVAAFVFGLVHGFGFAAALKDLGLSSGSLAVSLFGFNAGVELGQLAIVGSVIPLAYAMRNTRFYRIGIMGAGSALVALVASAWFVERAFDISLPGIGV
jgi:hypothetical protein